MSALPPKADIAERYSHVSFGPQGDIGEVYKLAMSALPPKADIAERYSHVSFGPQADIGEVYNLGLA